MRNWRPKNERAEVDAVIRKVRTAGIECAPWETGGTETFLATAIDGAAVQAFLLLSPAGRKKRVSSILTKGGIADAWTGEPESRRSVDAAIAAAGMDAPMLAVSRSYLDRTLSHCLALTAERGEAPPLGLLQVAETVGGADWQPTHMDFRATRSALIAELPKAMRSSTAVSATLRKSGELTGLDAFEHSWFEDDPEVARIVAASGRTGARAKLAVYLLQSVIARRRDKWADLFLRTAVWMREAPADADLCWRELTIVSEAIAGGCDLSEIGLMRNIAERTIAAVTVDM